MKADTFKSFQTEVNSQFDVVQTEPIDKFSKRVGLIGYKMGCTHFWNRWGAMMLCTVIQVDRC